MLASSLIFKGMAGVFQKIADDRTGTGELIAILDGMLDDRR